MCMNNVRNTSIMYVKLSSCRFVGVEKRSDSKLRGMVKEQRDAARRSEIITAQGIKYHRHKSAAAVVVLVDE